MQRYETDVRDGVLYLQTPAGAAAEPDEAGSDAGEEGDGTAGGDEGDGSTGTDEDDPADAWLEVGPMDDVVELIGGEEYVLEYDERQRQVGWLDTDEDGRLVFDVRETIRTTDFDDEFAEAIAGAPAEATGAGHSKRAELFADLLTTIWDAKGNL